MAPRPDPFGPPFPVQPEKRDVHLRILNLTDLHMNIRGCDYFTDSPTKNGGLARAATLIEALREDAPNCLLFENGDTLQGNPMGDHLALGDEDGAHPMIAALNALAVDAATIGNHEFNYGLPFLTRALADARFPIVSANILTVESSEPWLPPYVLLDRKVTDGAGGSHDLKVGLTGFAPPQITAWDRNHLEGRILTRDIVESALTVVPAMRAAGADLVIALSHSGIGASEPEPMMENASAALARVPGIDVVIAGHLHRVFPSADYRDHSGADVTQGTLHGTPTTMAGVGGSHIGQVDLLLRQEREGWTVAQSRAIAPRVSDHPLPQSDAELRVLKASDAAHEATKRQMRHPIGTTAAPLDSHFGMVEPASSVLLVATAQAAHAKAAFHGTDLEDIPLLSAAASFRLGSGGSNAFTAVRPGDVTLRHIADLYAFPNAFGAVLVDGKALRDWLDHAAGFFRQILPGETNQPLINPAFPAYNFDTITGLTYRIDLAAPPRFTPQGELLDAGSRIRDLAYKGAPVRDTDTFLIATNDYRTSGLGTFPGADQGQRVTAAAKSHRDILIDYFQNTPAARALAAPPWSLTAPSGTSVTFTSALGAQPLQRPDIEQMGETETGLPIFRKTF